MAMIDDKLAEMPIFQKLTRAQIEELNGWLVRMEFEAGATVVKEGAASDGLYVLAKGSVEVLRGPHGHPVVIATLQSPSVFGEMGVLSDEPRTAEVRAKEHVVLGFLPALVLHARLDANNVTALRIALNLGHIACARLRATTRKLTELSEIVTRDPGHV
jgi:CRP-like cAMP-binding protein